MTQQAARRSRDSAPLKLAVVISGRGGNMLAIAAACRTRRIAAEIVLVVSDQPSAAGLERARALGLPTVAIEAARFPAAAATRFRPGFETALHEAIATAGAELVVLAGFMRILSPEFVARYAGRILNIHPSILPAYPGLHTHRRVLEAREREHGASVHFVTAELDGGPIVLQSRIPVLPGDDEASLSGRIHQTEHILYPRVIDLIATGRLVWNSDGPWLDGRPLAAPQVLDA